MKIRKVRYAQRVPGKIERHYVAFLTRSGEILLMGHFLNSGDASHTAGKIMEGKESSTSFFPFPIGLVWQREHYDKRLAEMAKAGELVGCMVVENAPESIEELQCFASNDLRGQLHKI